MKTSSHTLESVLERVIDHRGKTPKKLGADWTESGVQVASAKLMIDGRLDLARERRFVSEATYKKWMPVPLRRGDVLLTSEAPLGAVAYLDNDDPLCLGQRLFALRARDDRLYPRFLYYLLKSTRGRASLEERATGTTVVGIRQSELVKVRVDLPDLDEQRRIADLLGALDDKIDVNKRMTTHVRELFEAEFSSWISHEMPASTEDLGKLAELTKGVSYRRADLDELSTTAMVTLKSVGRGGVYRRDGLKPYAGKYKSTQVLLEGDLAVAQTDVTQAADLIGRVIEVGPTDEFDTLVASLDLIAVRPTAPGVTKEFLLGSLLQPSFRHHCLARANGTTVLHLAKDALPTYRVPLPDGDSIGGFSDRAAPLLALGRTAARENVTLTELRDALLPKLLSGELRVREAEEAVEDVA